MPLPLVALASRRLFSFIFGFDYGVIPTEAAFWPTRDLLLGSAPTASSASFASDFPLPYYPELAEGAERGNSNGH
jgi:hypothetical protein